MGNRVENIPSIPKTSLREIQDKSKTKLTSVSFFPSETLHWVSYDFIMLIFHGFQDKSNYILFADKLERCIQANFQSCSFRFYKFVIF